jgi:hypothetical protein
VPIESGILGIETVTGTGTATGSSTADLDLIDVMTTDVLNEMTVIVRRNCGRRIARLAEPRVEFLGVQHLRQSLLLRHPLQVGVMPKQQIKSPAIRPEICRFRRLLFQGILDAT